MEIRQSDNGDVVVLELLGRLDELAAPEVQETFTELVNHKTRRVVLDMAGVEYISSSGLRVLLMLYRALSKRQGALKLCALTPFVAEVFEVSNFTTVFDIHPNREDAVHAFGQGA